MLRWLRVVASGGLLVAAKVFAQTGYQAEQLVPDPILKTPATPESMLMRAGYEERHKDCLDSGFHIEAVLHWKPDWAGAWAMRLPCDRKEYRRVDEVDDLSTLIRLQPENWRWWSERAQVYEKNYDRKVALADLNHATDLRPWEVDLYARRSFVKEDLHDYSGAFADLMKIHELIPESPLPLQNMAARVVLYGRSEAEAARYRKLAEIGAPKLEDSPRNDDKISTDGMRTEEAMLRAGYARSLKKWGQELRFLNAALKTQPGATRALEMRIELAMMLPQLRRENYNQPDIRLLAGLKPMLDVNELIKLSPKRADYYRMRISVTNFLSPQHWFGPVEQAEMMGDYNIIVALEPYEAANYASRGKYEMEQKDPDAAVKDFMAALVLEPGAAVYAYQLSLAYKEQKFIAVEITALNLALVGEPDNGFWKQERAKLP